MHFKHFTLNVVAVFIVVLFSIYLQKSNKTAITQLHAHLFNVFILIILSLNRLISNLDMKFSLMET